jgi:hypothetical protein
MIISIKNIDAVFPFFAAFTVSNFISGVSSIIANPLVIAFRDSAEDKSLHQLKHLYRNSYIKFMLVAASIFSIIHFLPAAVYSQWIGLDAFRYFYLFIFPISLAVIMRQALSPLSSLLLATDLMAGMRFSAVIEMIINIVSSIYIVFYLDLGYIGWALVLGASSRILMTIFFDTKSLCRKMNVKASWFLFPRIG